MLNYGHVWPCGLSETLLNTLFKLSLDLSMKQSSIVEYFLKIKKIFSPQCPLTPHLKLCMHAFNRIM